MESSALPVAAGLGTRGGLGPRGWFVRGRRVWAPGSRLPSLPRREASALILKSPAALAAEGLKDVALYCETSAALKLQPHHHIKGSVV